MGVGRLSQVTTRPGRRGNAGAGTARSRNYWVSYSVGLDRWGKYGVFCFLNMEKQEQELNQVDQSPRFVWFAGDANPAWQMAGLSWSLLFLGGC